ncbi:hypothetical protein AJ85_21605 [Alkalihalobacillus alcalophilus ATCC 27647 = CGMCC 1.3604]|uniref:Uncharacterized protein n=1 Tax=Alkalihalobacillus alcalophilus ATCC 27647 = CGMCC 1.3604 TaxID=1218173 RepID=A0A094WIH5_ALKAL|nr:hypothetical protein [Alkalihalobacillus alcalophilus]KGA96631.1 hypothetical protein BALCAV_0215020 [Alkalihalobacillus alcalophilus ATCC 27647 = CGMCC 1.3604]MED1563619.1 hypothetical protein [Alkalihalobacillus alcalophilus]THG91985.1 hypothetical protein AJ85_21605 [Alkalihalobacillus alcalophilus ATCC 27647 = CGMCC 1.3604]
MLKIETLIKDTNINIGNKVTFLPISHRLSANLANQTLDENDQDYLEGAIRLECNSEVILTENMETTDLLFTWQTLAEPILTPGNKEYEVSILDSLFEVKIVTNNSGFTFSIHNTLSEDNQISNTIPKDEYFKAIIEGFLSFGDFIINNQFSFSEESSYSSFVQDYQALKQIKV